MMPKDSLFVDDAERQMRPYHRWLVAMVVLTLGSTCLLVSAGHGAKEGTQPWAYNSMLRAVVEMLNFQYAYPTTRGTEVKWLTQGLGAAAALMTAGLVWYVRTGRRREEEELARLSQPEASSETSPSEPAGAIPISPVTAAQILMLGFGIWAILSFLWAHWPAAALGEGLRNLFVIIWAVALGRTLNRWSSQRAGIGMAVVLTVTAVLGIWYHYERNPTLRLEFPIGNPLFFAACMLPGLMLAVAGVAYGIEQMVREASADSSAAGRNASTGRWWVPVLILGGSAVSSAIIGWAFWLTDSRSPAAALLVALAAGVAALLVRWVSPARRRLVVLGVVAVALVTVLLVVLPWFEQQKTVAAGGRGATLRMRSYAWRYAGDMFFVSPLAGNGQGSYLCLSHGMAIEPRDDWGRSDLEKDPLAFKGGLVGHAHNEWLEILADLGVIGFVLMAAALVLTFWAGWRAFSRTEKPAEKWFLLALMAALLAIIVEELADVALRMPALPIIFYTVVGLLWAFSMNPDNQEDAPGGLDRAVLRMGWLRPVGLVAAIVGTMMISSAVRRDWRGALAEGRAEDHLQKQRWDAAWDAAVLAGENRLVLENQILASLRMVGVAHAAASDRFEQLRAMLARQADPAQRPHVRAIAEEDITHFDRYFERCELIGTQLWNAVPGVHSVANWVAEMFLMKNEVEKIKPSLGLEPHPAAYMAAARHWREQEFRRDRFNTDAALQLLGISADRPIGYQVELLRLPLRGGPRPVGSLGAIESALRQVQARNPEPLNQHLDLLLQRAEPALSEPNPDLWPDPYAPETLRLKALLERVSGRYDQAVHHAARAVRLYESEQLRFYHPTVLSHGLGDLARWQFLAEPDQPQQAAEICRRAIDAWPETIRDEGQLALLRRELSAYWLAAGQEERVAELIRAQAGDVEDEDLSRGLGQGLAEVCSMFLERPPEGRPAAFERWLARSLSLAPNYPTGRWIAARAAIDQDRTDEAIEHLKVLVASVDDPQQLTLFLQSLLELYPDNTELGAFLESISLEPEEDESDSMPLDAGQDPGKPESIWSP